MGIIVRQDDSVRPDDDVVLRAGGGDVEALTRSAIENARGYEPLVRSGLIRSPFTMSVHIPRHGIAGHRRYDTRGGRPPARGLGPVGYASSRRGSPCLRPSCTSTSPG